MITRRVMLTISWFSAAILVAQVHCNAASWYVDDSAPPSGNGTSWTTAFDNLESAINAASNGDDIFIGAGNYYPTYKTDIADARSATFRVFNGIRLRGGYAGTGATDPNARDFALYETILSGDIGTANDADDNAYHVLTAPFYVGNTTLLEGLTVSGGNAYPESSNVITVGGGYFGTGGDSEPQFKHCRFVSNSASQFGGAIFLGASGFAPNARALIEHCYFSDNFVDTRLGDPWNDAGVGGAICAAHNVNIRDCEFRANRARSNGGAVASQGGSITRSSFIDNEVALETGGFAGWGGALEIRNGDIVNCRFVSNRALHGGGASLLEGSEVNFTNCLFNGNVAGWQGGAVYILGDTLFTAGKINCETIQLTSFYGCTIVQNEAVKAISGGGAGGIHVAFQGKLYLANTIIDDNTSGLYAGRWAEVFAGREDCAVFEYCCIPDLHLPPDEEFEGVGIGVIETGPNFVRPAGLNNVPGDEDDDFTLSSTSPCVDAGSNLIWPLDDFDIDQDSNTSEVTPIDLGRAPRFADQPTTDTGEGTAPICDIGAFEASCPGSCPGDVNGDGLRNGADLSIILANFQDPVEGCRNGDANRDGYVNGSDLSVLLANYLVICP